MRRGFCTIVLHSYCIESRLICCIPNDFIWEYRSLSCFAGSRYLVTCSYMSSVLFYIIIIHVRINTHTSLIISCEYALWWNIPFPRAQCMYILVPLGRNKNGQERNKNGCLPLFLVQKPVYNGIVVQYKQMYKNISFLPYRLAYEYQSAVS